MARILIAEHERAVADLMAANLCLTGHSCDQVYTGAQALQKLADRPYDLLLLDARLPDGARALADRLPDDLPLLCLTDRNRADGCGFGVDACLTKPFEVVDLLTKVDRVLRRTGKAGGEFIFHDLRVDLGGRRVRRAGQEVALTPQEYALLETLVVHRNLALSRDKLLEIAWGYDYQGETRTVDVHIQRLRRKLGLQKAIQTVYKIGYRLNTLEPSAPDRAV